MADRQISDLTAATQVTVDDLFVLEQNATAKKLTGQILMNDLATALDGHGGISDISYTAPVSPSLEGTLTITLADNTTYDAPVTNGNSLSNVTQYWAVSSSSTSTPSTWYTTLQTMTPTNKYLWSYTKYTFANAATINTTAQVIGVYGNTGQAWYVHIRYASNYPSSNNDMGTNPDKWIGVYSGTSASAPTSYTSYTWYEWKGLTGDTGNGIASVLKTSTSGLVDTYTVTFTNGNTTTFNVTNGSNISTITKTATSGLVDTYTVTLTNGNTTNFTVTNAKSITSISFTSNSGGGAQGTPGTTDTYTINYNDGDSATFTVYNGANGAGAVAKVDEIPATGDNVPLLTIGNGAPTTATAGNIKSRYFDSTNSVLYICVGYDSGTQTYDWRGAGVTVDSALSTSSENPVQNKVITNKVGTAALTTTAQNLSGAVNEHDSEIGTLSSLTTSATTSLVAAINELDGDIGSINTKIGSTTLPTTATTLTGAIDEVFDKVDDSIPATVSADLNTANSVQQLIKWDSNTLNTPYKAGLTSGTAGVVLSYSNSSSYCAQMVIVSGRTATFVRAKNSGTWGTWIGLEHEKLQFNSTSVAANAWSADVTYSDYGYKASVTLTGVTSSMIPEVVFGLTEAVSGNFAPITETYNGGIYLYAKEAPSAAITIPTIICWRGN